MCLTKLRAMKTYCGSGGIAPPILNLGTRWRWMVRFTPRPLLHPPPRDKSSRYPLRGPQRRFGHDGEGKKSYNCPFQELNSGRPDRSLASILTELRQLLTMLG